MRYEYDGPQRENRFRKSGYDIPNDYYEEHGDGCYYIDHQKHFTYSSVKGDFRIFVGKNCFVTTWRKKFVVVRDFEGKLLWKKEMHGEFAAISPNKAKVVLSAGRKISVHDINSGLEIGTSNSEKFKGFSGYLAWTDGKIISLESSNIVVFDEMLNKLYKFTKVRLKTVKFLKGLVLDPYNPNHINTLDANTCQLLKIDIKKKKVVKSLKLDRAPNHIATSRDGELLIVYCRGAREKPLFIYDTETFELINELSCEGKSGGVLMPKVNPKEEGSRYDKYDCTMWAPLPDLSPNKERLLINDPSGALHLWDAKDNWGIRTFDRKILDYVYDVKWIDDESFLVILNECKVAKMNIRGREVDFMVKEE